MAKFKQQIPLSIETTNLTITPVQNAAELQFLYSKLDIGYENVGQEYYNKCTEGGLYNIEVPFTDYVICLKGQEEPIGLITLDLHLETMLVEWCRYFVPGYEGKGYGSEAHKALLDTNVKPLIGEQVNYIENELSPWNHEQVTSIEFNVTKSDQVLKGAYGMVDDISNVGSLFSSLKVGNFHSLIFDGNMKHVVVSYPRTNVEPTDAEIALKALAIQESLEKNLSSSDLWLDLFSKTEDPYTVLYTARKLKSLGLDVSVYEDKIATAASSCKEYTESTNASSYVFFAYGSGPQDIPDELKQKSSVNIMGASDDSSFARNFGDAFNVAEDVNTMGTSDADPVD